MEGTGWARGGRLWELQRGRRAGCDPMECSPVFSQDGGKPGPARPMTERWAGNRWAPLPPADRLKIGQTEGQVWLALTALLVEPRCRAKYQLDEWRKERLLGLRRYLNELMFDQVGRQRLA